MILMLIDAILIPLGFLANMFGLFLLPFIVILLVLIFYSQTKRRGFLFIVLGQGFSYLWSIINSIINSFIIPQLIEDGMNLSDLDVVYGSIAIMSFGVYLIYCLFLIIGLNSIANDIRLKNNNISS